MTNEQIKQAYVIGKAAKGVLRFRAFQKQAMMKQAVGGVPSDDPAAHGGKKTDSAPPAGGTPVKTESTPKTDNPAIKEPYKSDYTTTTLAGSGIGAIMGALIQAARGKDILNGLLVGGGLGGLGGAGYNAYMAGDIDKMFAGSPTQAPEDTSAIKPA